MARPKFEFPAAGMGIILIKFCFVMAASRPVEVFVKDPNHLIYDIKRIWQVGDDRLTVTNDPTGAVPDIESDELAVYSGYHYANQIKLFGSERSTLRKTKHCVALTMHHGGGLGEDLDIKPMPYNKYGTMDEYAEIWKALTRAGYDVIVINSREISIEHKAWLLNEFCDCVIGYEGGLGHLAHMLRVPSMILPWKYCDDGGPPIPPGNYYEPHRFHPDRRTYFLQSAQELINWSPGELKKKINDLYEDKGNNILYSKDTTFDPHTLELRNGAMDLTPRISEHYKNLIRQFIPNLNPLGFG